MQFTYCRSWNDALWEPVEPLTEAEARERFDAVPPDSDRWFSVVAHGDGGAVDFVLEVVPGAQYVKTKFFEVSHSLGLTFGFARIDEQRLFLDEIVEYAYGDADTYSLESDAVVIDASSYTPEGLLHRTVDETSKPTVLEEDYRDVDVSGHWEPVPTFGDWESLGRYRRA